jgi:hypothetical protein
LIEISNTKPAVDSGLPINDESPAGFLVLVVRATTTVGVRDVHVRGQPRPVLGVPDLRVRAVVASSKGRFFLRNGFGGAGR